MMRMVVLFLNFNPRAPCGARPVVRFGGSCCIYISTHAPLAGRDILIADASEVLRNISTHAPLAGRDAYSAAPAPVNVISTHAPLAGRDPSPAALRSSNCFYFNPRAPCGARRVYRVAAVGGGLVFQPTRPLRGATGERIQKLQMGKNFNPRAPCGARPGLRTLNKWQETFQPTRPLRGATSGSNS